MFALKQKSILCELYQRAARAKVIKIYRVFRAEDFRTALPAPRDPAIEAGDLGRFCCTIGLVVKDSNLLMMTNQTATPAFSVQNHTNCGVVTI